MTRTENYTRELFSIFFAQGRFILWTTVLIFVLSVLIAFLWPPSYSATGLILVKGKKAEKTSVALEKEHIRSFPITKEDLASEEQILTSHDVIERTIKDLQKRNLYKKPLVLTKEVYRITNSLKTEVIPTSNVIKIAFYNKDPEVAVTVLEALINQYIIYRMLVHNPSGAELFFSQQADKFKEGLGRKEEDLMGLVKKTKMSVPLKEIENNIFIKKDLEQQLNILKNDAIEKRLYIKYLEKALTNKNIQYFSFIEDNEAISNLGISLQQLFVEYGNVKRTYHPSSEKAKSIGKQTYDAFISLKAEVEAYKENLFNQLQVDNTKIRSIESRLDSINNKNVELHKQLIDSQRMVREANLLQTSYETFYKRREEAKIYNSVDQTNLFTYVSILSKPFPSDGPVFPKKNVVIPLGLLVGFITGCSLGFLREFFDHTFKKPSDVHNYAGLSVIFSIPKLDNKKSKKTFFHLSLVSLLAIILLSGALLSIKELFTML